MNFRFSRPIAPLLVAAVTLSACSTTHNPVGSGLAMLKPAKPASTRYITGLQGGIIGRIDVDLSDSDRQRALEAEYRALEAAPGGQPVMWSGRGVSGKVVAAAPYQVGSQNCRQYTHTVTVDGRDRQARGAACRSSDGSWTPLN